MNFISHRKRFVAGFFGRFLGSEGRPEVVSIYDFSFLYEPTSFTLV